MASILIIDDDREIRELLAALLSKADHQVRLARDGFEGIKKFGEHPADIVICDIIMPYKEGIQTIDELVKDYPGVKIIAMSGGTVSFASEYLDIATKTGALRSLRKPISKKQLLSAVDHLLNDDA